MSSTERPDLATGDVDESALSANPADASLASGPGGGVAAVQALLANPSARLVDFVRAIDAHRGDYPAIVAFLNRAVGNARTHEILNASNFFRVSLQRKEAVYGDPSGEGGYFLASEQIGGARWRTGDGRFSGRAGV